MEITNQYTIDAWAEAKSYVPSDSLWERHVSSSLCVAKAIGFSALNTVRFPLLGLAYAFTHIVSHFELEQASRALIDGLQVGIKSFILTTLGIVFLSFGIICPDIYLWLSLEPPRQPSPPPAETKELAIPVNVPKEETEIKKLLHELQLFKEACSKCLEHEGQVRAENHCFRVLVAELQRVNEALNQQSEHKDRIISGLQQEINRLMNLLGQPVNAVTSPAPRARSRSRRSRAPILSEAATLDRVLSRRQPLYRPVTKTLNSHRGVGAEFALSTQRHNRVIFIQMHVLINLLVISISRHLEENFFESIID
jgi:hypothetical protein